MAVSTCLEHGCEYISWTLLQMYTEAPPPAQLSRKSPQGEELMMIPASDEIHCSPPAPAPQLPYMEQFRRPHCGRNHN